MVGRKEKERNINTINDKQEGNNGNTFDFN